MGLDLLEFVMEVEETFEIHIPDEDCVDIMTARKVIDYVAASLSAKMNDICRSQRAFYRLRKSLTNHVGCPRSSLRVDTSLMELIPEKKRDAVWEQVRHDVGLKKAARWPRLADPGWFDYFRGKRIATIGEAADTIASHPALSRGPDSGWTREQIAEKVHWLICDNFGVNRNNYTDDSNFHEDLGIE